MEISYSGSDNYVSYEALKRQDCDGIESRYFERKGKLDKSTVKPFDLLKMKQSDPRLNVRPNVSVISSLMQFAHPVANDLGTMFRAIFHTNVWINKFKLDPEDLLEFYHDHPSTLEMLNSYIRKVDLGIEGIEIDKVGEKHLAYFRHTGLDDRQLLYYESQGTKNFVCIFPNLAYALMMGGTAIMDEIDADLHPSLMPEIISWFHDKVTDQDAQLIMTCHNASILHHLVKEEVWFVQKGDDGCSDAYALSDIKGLRRDSNLYNKYMSGTFGAVPRLG